MTSIEGFEGDIERVDDLLLLFGLLQQMGIQSILDKGIQAHGNWQRLSPGWVMMVWPMHILSEQHYLTPLADLMFLSSNTGEDDYWIGLKRFDRDLGEEVEHALNHCRGSERIITVTVTPLQAQLHKQQGTP